MQACETSAYVHVTYTVSLQGGTTLNKNQIGNADKKRDLKY